MYAIQKYHALNTIPIHSRMDNDESTTDDSNNSSLYLLKQFFWPTFDDPTIQNKTIVYTSRLYAAVYLGICGIIIIFKINLELREYLHQQILPHLNALKEYNNNEVTRPITNNGEQLKMFVNDVLDHFIELLSCLAEAFLYGGIIGLIAGLYASMIVFRAYKKKTLELRTNRLSWNYRKETYPVWYSTKFISVLTSYLITASIMFTILFVFFLTLFLDKYFWKFIGSIWRYIVGYVLYYFAEYVIIQWIILGSYLTENGSIKSKKTKIFQFILILDDLMYLPLAAWSGIFRMLFWLIFCFLSYLRPDINVYPQGLENWDYGHLTFVATVRLMVEREAEFIEYHKRNNQNNNNISMNNAIELAHIELVSSDE